MLRNPEASARCQGVLLYDPLFQMSSFVFRLHALREKQPGHSSVRAVRLAEHICSCQGSIVGRHPCPHIIHIHLLAAAQSAVQKIQAPLLVIRCFIIYAMTVVIIVEMDLTAKRFGDLL